MQLSHDPSVVESVFDEANLVSCVGLAPVMALAEQAGLTDLLTERLSVPAPPPYPRRRRAAPDPAAAEGRRTRARQALRGDLRDDGRDVRGADGGVLRRPGTGRGRGAAAVSVDNAVGLALAVLLTVFLVAALLFPERF